MSAGYLRRLAGEIFALYLIFCARKKCGKGLVVLHYIYIHVYGR